MVAGAPRRGCVVGPHVADPTRRLPRLARATRIESTGAAFTRRVNVDLGIWSKLTKVVVGLVVLAVLLLIGMCYLPVIRDNERMRRPDPDFSGPDSKRGSPLRNFRRRWTPCCTIRKPSNA